MFEYSTVLGNDLSAAWDGQILPFIDMIRNSPYFWPGVVAAAVTLALVTRQIIK